MAASQLVATLAGRLAGMEAMVAWLQQALEQTRDKYRREGAAVTLYQEHRRLWAASVVGEPRRPG